VSAYRQSEQEATFHVCAIVGLQRYVASGKVFEFKTLNVLLGSEGVDIRVFRTQDDALATRDSIQLYAHSFGGAEGLVYSISNFI
jgi:hypothetical protein